MAINIEFEGYVNETKGFSWGWVAKVAHSQRAKNEATGQWETVGKDYFDVTLPEGALVTEGTIVRVKGTLKVGTYEKKDGTTGVALKVRAQEITPVERAGQSAPASAPAGIPTSWEPADESLPF